VAERRERTVEVNGVPVRLQSAGSGRPLVYLHGANGAAWPAGLDPLAERFEVLLPEHPGFGASPVPDWLESVQDLALHYLDLFETLGLRQVNLVGQSLGGWTAREVASLCGHHLRRLVVAAPAGLRVEGVQAVDPFALAPEQATRALYHDQSIPDRLLVVEPTPEQIALQVRNRGMTARLAWKPQAPDAVWRRRLGRIRVPTLLLWGAQDRLAPLAQAEVYRQAIPGARLEVIEGCGHIPATERPTEFGDSVARFLDED
jgi:pimeloyl-ACP methyl ester carboxylesterase